MRAVSALPTIANIKGPPQHTARPKRPRLASIEPRGRLLDKFGISAQATGAAPVTFEGSRREAAKHSLVFALFTSVGLWIAMAADTSRHPPIIHQAIGALSSMVFSTFFVVSFAWLISPTHVTIRADGFTIRQFSRTTKHSWADIEDLWTNDNVFVVWTKRCRTRRPIWLRWLKGDGMICGLWDVSVNEIAWEMKRHLAAA